MPKWFVEIYVGNDVLHLGEPFVRVEPQSVVSFLMSLNEPSLKIVKVESYHFWVSPDFDSLGEEEQVLEFAKNQLPNLNGILQLKFDPNICSVKIGDVFHLDENGGLVRSTMKATLTGSKYPDESVLQAKDAQKPATLDILFKANNNALIAEALQHLATSHNWYSLIKIFEIIRKDAGKKENNGALLEALSTCGRKGEILGSVGLVNLSISYRQHTAIIGAG